jgi:DNA-binding transcriptional regulator YdaS (Cro superfamily)
MTLDAYLKRPDAKTLTELAGLVGISKGRLSQLRASTAWPPQLALDVEKATDGGVNAAGISKTIADARKGMAA